MKPKTQVAFGNFKRNYTVPPTLLGFFFQNFEEIHDIIKFRNGNWLSQFGSKIEIGSNNRKIEIG